MKKLSSEDRSRLIKLASNLPKGSPEKRAILAGLKSAYTPPTAEENRAQEARQLRTVPEMSLDSVAQAKLQKLIQAVESGVPYAKAKYSFLEEIPRMEGILKPIWESMRIPEGWSSEWEEYRSQGGGAGVLHELTDEQKALLDEYAAKNGLSGGYDEIHAHVVKNDFGRIRSGELWRKWPDARGFARVLRQNGWKSYPKGKAVVRQVSNHGGSLWYHPGLKMFAVASKSRLIPVSFQHLFYLNY